RKALGFAAGERRYVLRIVPEDNIVVVGGREELLAPGLIASRVNWLMDSPASNSIPCLAKSRYRHTPAQAVVTRRAGDGARLRFPAERPRVFGPVSVALEKPFALIGSGVNADLRLDDNQVSHRHLYLQVYDGRVFAVDLGSRTGTFWEAGRQAYGWLDRGQSL